MKIRFSDLLFTYIQAVFSFSFLTTLDIYNDCFKGCHKVVALVVACILWLETIFPSLSFSWRSYCICTQLGFVTKELLHLHIWMNWRTLQPTSFSSWCVSHILGSMHRLVSHVLGAVHWKWEIVTLLQVQLCIGVRVQLQVSIRYWDSFTCNRLFW